MINLKDGTFMVKMKMLRKGYNSTYKVGEYEFLVEFNYLPLFFIIGLIRVRIILNNPKVGRDPWKKSVIVRHSESRNMIQMLISSYIEDAGYFKLK
jgi:hypothetical protein